MNTSAVHASQVNFATRPELLILDEPTSGLDPLMEAAFRDTVAEARKDGCTVFLSSHILLVALLFATLPRLSSGGALAPVGVAFLWGLLGALVSAPSWLLALSPFHHVAAVPQSAFDAQGAFAMVGVAVAAGVAAVEVFIRRDLQSG